MAAFFGMSSKEVDRCTEAMAKALADYPFLGFGEDQIPREAFSPMSVDHILDGAGIFDDG